MKKTLKKLARISGSSALIFVMVVGMFAVIPPKKAQAAVSFVGSAVNSLSPNGTLTVTLPGSMQANDLIIVAAGVGDTATNGLAAPTQGGYARVPGVAATLYANDTNDTNLDMYYKFHNGTDTQVSFTGVGGTNASNVAVVMVFRDVDTTTPFDVNATTVTGIDTSAANPPSNNHNNPSGVWTVIAASTGYAGTGTGTFTFPTGYTTNAAQDTHEDTIDVIVGMGYRSSGVTDPEDPAAFSAANVGTAANNGWAAVTMALRPLVLAAPTVTTQAASLVGQNTATANGNITATGGQNATVRGIAWGTNSALSGGDTATTTNNGSFSTGAFTENLSSLACGTTYYYRPYATNPTGTGLGTITNFNTSACAAPTVTTQAESNVTATTVTVNGNITATGGANATVRGFAYGTSATLATVIATTTENGSFSTGAFTGSLSSLTCNTTYYSRPYATNPTGTGFGTIDSFITSACPTTTLGAGDLSAGGSLLAPGTAAIQVGDFTFITNSGTDTVTALTVDLGGANSFNGIAKVEIKDATGVTDQCTDIDNPSSTTLNFSSCTLAAGVVETTFTIYATAKTHANMPAPPGADYTFSPYVTAWTSSNAQAGSDNNGNTTTYDNLSTANVSSATASGASNETQHTISWSNPADADLEEVVVLRRSGSAVADTPVEGTDYATSTALGSSVVACEGFMTSCTDSGLTAGTAYHYKIFAKDGNKNYSANGVTPTGSPVTSSATFTQQAYRFFASSAGVTPGAALANQDTPATLTSAGETFRMRMLIRVDTKDINSSGRSFKLQYAAKSGTCDASFTGETYADITDVTPIAFADIPAISDNSALGAQADMTDGARTIVNQTYEELNNFTNSQGSIASGQDGKWDFSFIDNTGQAGVVYCIRAVKSDGGTLDTYTSIAEISTAAAGAPDIQQIHYRWRNDNGSESGATYLANEDTAVTTGVYKGDRVRLRFTLSNAGTASADDYTYMLEHASSSCTAWFPVPAVNAVANEHWAMDLSTNLLDSGATTDLAGLTNPGGKSFVAGFVKTQGNQGAALSLGTTGFTELEYSIRSTANATTTVTYCFRLTNAGYTTNMTYSVQPQITLTGIVSRPSGGGGGGGGTSGGAGGETQTGGGSQQTGGTGGGTGGAGTGGAGGESQTGGGQQQGGGGAGGGGGDSGYSDYRKAFASAVLWIIR